MLLALGRCPGLFSEGVTSWDETGQCCHWRIIPFFLFENFGACWFLSVSTILWLTHRDCRIFIVRAWCSECVHTLDLGLSSHPKDVESHQSQVIGRLIQSRKSLSLTGLEQPSNERKILGLHAECNSDWKIPSWPLYRGTKHWGNDHAKSLSKRKNCDIRLCNALQSQFYNIF